MRDIAEDVEVGNRTSFTTRLAKILPSDMLEDADIGGNDNGGDNKTVERLSFKKLSGPTKYLTSLHYNTDKALFKKR